MAIRVGWYPFTRNSAVASVRLRCLNPMTELRRRGMNVELYNPRHRTGYDVVIFAKNYSSAALAEAENLKGLGCKVAVDLCDNHFYNPKGLEEWEERAERLRSALQQADAVVSSSSVLADVIRREAAPRSPIHVIGDALEPRPRRSLRAWANWARHARHRLGSTQALKLQLASGGIGLVWFGNHGSPNADAGGMGDMSKLEGVIHRLRKDFPVFLTIISNSRARFESIFEQWTVPRVYFDWNPVDFRKILERQTVALLPATLNNFTACKTNNRLVLSIDAGLAVVADSVPSYEALDGAYWRDDWEPSLRECLRDPDERQRRIAVGRSIIAADWTLPRISDRWAALIRDLAH